MSVSVIKVEGKFRLRKPESYVFDGKDYWEIRFDAATRVLVATNIRTGKIKSAAGSN